MRSLWHFRGTIWRAAIGDFRHRYAGSGFGVLWNIATPLVMLVLYTVIFSGVLATRVAPTTSLAAAAFPLYLGSGFLPWVAFAECLSRGANAFVTNAMYLRKLAVPEQVFVAQVAVSATLSMLIAIVLLVGLALAFGQPPQPTWLLLPVIVVLWQAFGFGLSLALSTLNTYFRDVAQFVGVGLQIWMWSLPVVYVEDILPAAYRATLPFNPGYPFIRAIRDTFLNGVVPELWVCAGMVAWVLAAFAAGFAILGGLRRELRDLV